MYLYFILHYILYCDVSTVDCSVGLGTRWVRQKRFLWILVLKSF